VKLVVGLGNPGPEYAATRHNVGFCVVERLAARHAIALAPERRFQARFGRGVVRGVAVAVLEPWTYMNRSGQSVVAALDALPLEDPAQDLVVVYDDLDLPFARLRVRPAGGAGGHNGLGDVQERLGRSDFPRLRFGIGRPPEGEDPVDYVLAPFSAEESEALPAALDRAVDALESLLGEGVRLAMDRFNRSPASPSSGGPGQSDHG
jgi:PTH1 family peptidyl-tRNA hydrolase